MQQFIQGGLVDILIIIAIATAAHRGWTKGFLDVCAPIIAAALSIFIIRKNGFGFLNGLVSILMSTLSRIIVMITKVPIDRAESNILFDTVSKSAGGTQLSSSIQFLFAFSILTIVIRLTIKSLGAHHLPFIGDADSLLGAGTCIIARLLVIWTIMTIMVALSGANDGIAQITTNLDKGLFHVLYANNPIQKYLLIKYTQFIR